jgi:hypothetical protein
MTLDHHQDPSLLLMPEPLANAPVNSARQAGKRRPKRVGRACESCRQKRARLQLHVDFVWSTLWLTILDPLAQMHRKRPALHELYPVRRRMCLLDSFLSTQGPKSAKEGSCESL